MDLNNMIMLMHGVNSSNSNLRNMLQELRSANESEKISALSSLCTELNSSSLPGFVAMNALEIFNELMKCLSSSSSSSHGEVSGNQMIAILASRALNAMLDLVPRLSMALGMRDHVKVILEHVRSVMEIDVTEECIISLERIIHTRPNAQTVLEADGIDCLLSSVDFFIIASQRKAWEVIACCARCVSSSNFEKVHNALPAIRNAMTNSDAKLSFKASQTMLRIVTNLRHDVSLLEEAYGNLSEVIMLMLTRPNYDDPVLVVALEIVEIGVTHSVHILQSAFDSGLVEVLLRFLRVENTQVSKQSITTTTTGNVTSNGKEDDSDDLEEKDSHFEFQEFSNELQLLLCSVVASFLPRLRHGVREFIPDVALLECRLPSTMYFDPKEFNDKMDFAERESVLLKRGCAKEINYAEQHQAYTECVINNHTCDWCKIQCKLLNWFRCNQCDDFDLCATCYVEKWKQHASGKHTFTDMAYVFGYDGVLPHDEQWSVQTASGTSHTRKVNKSGEQKVTLPTSTTASTNANTTIKSTSLFANSHGAASREENKMLFYFDHEHYALTILQTLPFILQCALNAESVLARCHCMDYLYTASFFSEQSLRRAGWRANDVATVIMTALSSPFACLQLSAISLSWRVITEFLKESIIRLIREGVAHKIEQLSTESDKKGSQRSYKDKTRLSLSSTQSDNSSSNAITSTSIHGVVASLTRRSGMFSVDAPGTTSRTPHEPANKPTKLTSIEHHASHTRNNNNNSNNNNNNNNNHRLGKTEEARVHRKSFTAAECTTFLSGKVNGQHARSGDEWNELVSLAARYVLSIFPHFDDDKRTSTLHSIIQCFKNDNLRKAFQLMQTINASELSSYELLSIDFVHELNAALIRANSVQAVMMFIHVLLTGSTNQNVNNKNANSPNNIDTESIKEEGQLKFKFNKSPLTKFIQSLHSVFDKYDNFDVGNCLILNDHYSNVSKSKDHADNHHCQNNNNNYNNNNNNNKNIKSSAVKYKPVVLSLIPHEVGVANVVTDAKANANWAAKILEERRKAFTQKAAAPVPADVFASVLSIRRFVYSTLYPMWTKYRSEQSKEINESTLAHHGHKTPHTSKHQNESSLKLNTTNNKHDNEKGILEKETCAAKQRSAILEVKDECGNNNNNNNETSAKYRSDWKYKHDDYYHDKKFYSVDHPKKEINMEDYRNVSDDEANTHDTHDAHNDYANENNENDNALHQAHKVEGDHNETDFKVNEKWEDEDEDEELNAYINDDNDDDDEEEEVYEDEEEYYEEEFVEDENDVDTVSELSFDYREDITHENNLDEERERRSRLVASLERLSEEEHAGQSHMEQNVEHSNEYDVDNEEEEGNQKHTPTHANNRTTQEHTMSHALNALKRMLISSHKVSKPRIYLRLGEYVLPNSMIVLEIVQLLNDLKYTTSVTSTNIHQMSFVTASMSSDNSNNDNHNNNNNNDEDTDDVTDHLVKETVAHNDTKDRKTSNKFANHQENAIEIYYSDVPFGKEYKPWRARKEYAFDLPLEELRVAVPSRDTHHECERAVLAQLHNPFHHSSMFSTTEQRDVLILLGILHEVICYWNELTTLFPASTLTSVNNLLNDQTHSNHLVRDKQSVLEETTSNVASLSRKVEDDELHGKSANSLSFKSDPYYHGAPACLRDFENIRLNSKVWRQYCNVLAAAQIPGSWAVSLALDCNFLFSHATRRFLFSVAFCDAFRAAHRVQEELTNTKNRWERLGGSSSNSNGQSLFANYYSLRSPNELPVITLQRMKVKVKRDNVLDDAMLLVKENLAYDHRMFEYEFKDEEGSGSGPTREFYALVAQALRQRALQLWRGSDEDANSLYYTPLNGLYPLPCEPHSIQSQKLIEYFEFIGVFVARALMDDQIPVMPFSSVLLKMLRGDVCGIEDVTQVSTSLGVTLEAMLQSTRSCSNTITLPGQRKEFTIDDMGLDFVLPGSTNSSIELIPNGSNIPVTSLNVTEYIDHVVSFMLNIGVRRAVRAMRQGFQRLVPLTALRVLTVEELFEVFNGSQRAITLKELEENCSAEHGFTLSCTHVRWFFEIVTSFNTTEQRNLIMFLTGCPHLPVGGMSSLRPRMTIVRKTAVTDECGEDDLLPSVMTCQNYLKMPAYSSKALMETKLRQAMKEGNGPFLLT